ncbi:BCCT family transporter [Pseudonocardia sp. NPDC046786]|uniref:BCCT family transporter n=1 Tax=Pseudonocardia sp. NPDC046786 TaxID=3155471 RepID=UPI0033FF35F3
MFISSAVLAVAFVLWGVISPTSLGEVAGAVNTWITDTLGWLYIFSATGFLIFVLFLMMSRYGRVKLGPSDSTPEYGNTSWFAMLFTAGMGIGLVFYAVSEPISHFTAPPTGEPSSPEAARDSMLYTFFHWGLHPWAIYIVLGLSLGYFAFRRGLPLRPAAALYPLLKERINGWPGYLVDVLAVFGTLFGLATSLGIGAQQVAAGLDVLFGWENTTTLQVLLILGITAVAIASLMLGLDKGIRRLALLNLWLALALMLFVFFFGPTRDLLNSLAANMGSYVQEVPGLSFQTFPDGGNGTAAEWQSGWTLFYWGWWISWSPFVGMFLARISYGRTIRQFVAGCLFAPVGASMVWLTVFGNSALELVQNDPDHPLATAAPETAIYVLLAQLPVAQILITLASVLTVFVVVLFFATSSDSGSLVVDILTNGGDPNPRWQQRLFWAVLEGVIAAVLLAAGAATGADALSALQTAAIVAGLPLGIVLILMAIGLSTALRDEKFVVALPPEPSPLDSLRRSTSRAEPGPDDDRPAGQRTGSDPLMCETAVAEFATSSPSDGGDDPGRASGPGDRS